MLKIIEKTKIWFIASLLIISIGMGFLAAQGLNLGIDFAGGTVLQVDLKKTITPDEISAIRDIAAKYANDTVVSTLGTTGISIRSSELAASDTGNANSDKSDISKLIDEISAKYNIDKTTWSTEYVGPSIGAELKQNAILALIISFIAMLIYIAIRFEIKFGVAAVLALVHDILITLSVYTILQIPVNSSFIAALLTIVGYSINDTIVIFDRIRENMKLMKKVSHTELADVSITQTMARSINTVLTVVFTITAVYFIGVSAVKELALPLIIGIISGCYSSIFIASPIWVWLKNRESRKKVAAVKA